LNLPTTPDLLAQSNLRIYNALFDIANFYRDILDDKKEAINTYEKILKRYPNNPNRPAIDYSLYRLYSELHDPKADAYKNDLLKNYPETNFAKVIVDPEYSKKLDDNEAEFKAIYNQIFDLYAKRKYPEVISHVDDVMKKYPNNSLGAQLDYLRAVAKAHDEPVADFVKDLQNIVKKYPNDRLITPLAKQHINYITANLVDLSRRHYALENTDTTSVPYTPLVENKKETPYRVPGRHFDFDNQVVDVRKPVKKADSAKKAAAQAAIVSNPITKGDSVKAGVSPVLAAVVAPVKKPYNSKLFSKRDSTNYYFIINIANDNTNPASSRFSIGQFNRTNYDGRGITHQLMQVGDNNRFIYIGRFYSLGEVKAYARAIVPLLGEIMKIPKAKYSFFIITKQNLDKLADKNTLDSYIDYYQNNY